MLSISEPTFLGKEHDYLLTVLRTRFLSGGSFVRKFEQLLADAHLSTEAMVTTSGTTALHLALLALGVKPGDKVVVPACSYIATANAVRYCGAEPIFVDSRPETWTMHAGRARAKAEATGAVGVIVVHLYGQPADLPIHLPPGVWVLEDSCEAHGQPLRGDAAVFSFYGNKIITCGEGGAVLTHRSDVAEKVRLLRGQGTTGAMRYFHEELGYNYRMTDLQAAIGCAQIEMLTQHLSRRRQLFEEYRKRLPNGVVLQQRDEIASDWVLPVLVSNRDEVAKHLQAVGIETRPVFPPLHKQPQYLSSETLPVSESLARDGLLLPLHLQMGVMDVIHVCDELSIALEATK